MLRVRIFAVLLCTMVVGACLAPPELPPRRAAPDLPAPELLPQSELLGARADGVHTERLRAGPDPRAAALRARAAQLRGPVIADPDRARLTGSEARLR